MSRQLIAPALGVWAVLALGVCLSSCSGGTGVSTSPPAPGSPPGSAAPTPVPPLTLSMVAAGLSNPDDIEGANDGTGRLFVLEQAGRVRVVQNGTLLATPFLDISGKVFFSGESGLIGMALHPNFAQNRRFLVHYVRQAGGIQSVIAEYQASAADPNQADPASERIILTVDQPDFTNHKGGQLAFGPDGFLYIALGDGGSEGDPMGNGQNVQTLLGKILRIDVDHAAGGNQYAVPADNPFAAGGGRPEIWAFGLRNPWRFSFDRATGRLFAGDVGGDRFEEVDLIQRGGNYGWNIMEGAHCFNSPTGCNMSGLTLPITEIPHNGDGEVVIGGYVYHGNQIPALQQIYVFGDFALGKIWMLQEGPPGAWVRTLLLTASGRNLSAFGQDQAGEIYVADYASGSVLRLAQQ